MKKVGDRFYAEDADCETVRRLVKEQTGVDVSVKVRNGRFVVTDPAGEEFETGLVRTH